MKEDAFSKKLQELATGENAYVSFLRALIYKLRKFPLYS